MYTHTSKKIKLKKQIFLIDIFYSNYKENLYNIFGSMLCKVAGDHPSITKTDTSITKTDHPIITKTDGFITKDHYIKHKSKQNEKKYLLQRIRLRQNYL